MAKVYVFNTSSVGLMFSINNGTYIAVNGTSSTFLWTPLTPATQPIFVNQTNPPQGQLGLGDNKLTMYPQSSGSSDSATVILCIPTDVTVSSIQLYMMWKDARNLGAVLSNGGQFVQAVSLTDPDSQAT
jgi:hypothetical protein